MIEREFIELLKKMPLHEGANGLMDDCAVIPFGDQNLVLTKDMMVEGVHYFPDADPEDVAWKLLAVNLSDLAAKGAMPIGVMLGFTLNNASGDDDWDKAFVRGFETALRHYDVKLIGGDTVSSNARILSLTAIGMSDHDVPSRSYAQDDDILYVSGPLGDAYAGYEMIKSGEYNLDNDLVRAFNRPHAQLELGQRLAHSVHAMMDISDGLLIDAKRMADASGCKIEITLEDVPLSRDYRLQYGADLDAIISASTWGDDYQLLFSAPNAHEVPTNMMRIGSCSAGEGLSLSYKGKAIDIAEKLGFEH